MHNSENQIKSRLNRFEWQTLASQPRQKSTQQKTQNRKWILQAYSSRSPLSAGEQCMSHSYVIFSFVAWICNLKATNARSQQFCVAWHFFFLLFSFQQCMLEKCSVHYYNRINIIRTLHLNLSTLISITLLFMVLRGSGKKQQRQQQQQKYGAVHYK